VRESCSLADAILIADEHGRRSTYTREGPADAGRIDGKKSDFATVF